MNPIFETPQITLYAGDCLEILPQLPDRSIDLILTDLPYGITLCDWDKKIPLDKLWIEWKRVIKPKSVVALFGTQPFTSELVLSNPKWFKYEWIWEKDNATNFGCANYQPLRYHENIVIFSGGRSVYHPQMKEVGWESNKGGTKGVSNVCFKTDLPSISRNQSDRFPSTIIKFDRPKHNSSDALLHNTQKPVSLLSYLIQTYTNPGDTVLDCTCGSGSTLVAARDTGRNAIGIELDPHFVEVAIKRCSQLAIFQELQEATT